MQTSSLTSYEAGQVAEIAAWKARRPGLIRRAAESVKWPLDHLLTKFLPAEEARKLFTRAHKAADWDLGRDAFRRALNLEDIGRLRDGPLEHCDDLVVRVRDLSRELITSESLLANAGGIATELLELPSEILLALRTVHRVAACYGYELRGSQSETLVLAIVGLSLLTDPRERLRARRLIRELEDASCPAGDEQELSGIAERRLGSELREDLAEEVGASLLEDKLGEGIPFLGAALGVLLDNEFISAVEESSRRTFQERWLREHGKVDEIPPAAAEATIPLRRRLADAVYSAGYAVGFGVVFPASLVSRACAAVLPAPAAEGLADGSLAARRDAENLLSSASVAVPARVDPLANGVH
ncbi:EcsC protein family protein [Aquisphaera giovannonii]|uniref:EcsC protein family protein n=1 Tax=Aquisphaera giovannonii TaxID=406548 RepID=A0A5B9WAH5_9BACT|nr:EcsC family protein [Aquisphaera giovannonii]QEH37249.1 EcsC protein family protein [Aquisphaera giovannonii]